MHAKEFRRSLNRQESFLSINDFCFSLYLFVVRHHRQVKYLSAIKNLNHLLSFFWSLTWVFLSVQGRDLTLDMPDRCFACDWNMLLSLTGASLVSGGDSMIDMSNTCQWRNFHVWRVEYLSVTYFTCHWQVFYQSIEELRPLTSILPVSDKFTNHIFQNRLPFRDKHKIIPSPILSWT